MNTCTVVSVDRSRRIAQYLPHPLPPNIVSLDEIRSVDLEAGWLHEIPCPWTEQYITDDGHLIIGPVGGAPDLIMRDHFAFNATVSDKGDGNWTVTVAGGGAGASSGGQAGVGLGVNEATSRNAIGAQTDYSKFTGGIAPEAAEGHWVNGRFRIGVAISSFAAFLGLNGVNDGVIVQMDTSVFGDSRIILNSTKDAATTGVSTEYLAVLDEWVDFDLVFAAGEFATLTINPGSSGPNGPYVATTNVPTTGDNLQIQWGVLSRSANPRRIEVDWIEHRALRVPPVSPAGLVDAVV